MLCHWVCWVFADTGETVRQGVPGLAFFLRDFLWLSVPPPFSAFLYRVGLCLCPSSLSILFTALHYSSHLDPPFLALLSCNVLLQLIVFFHIQVRLPPSLHLSSEAYVVCAGPCHQGRLYPECSVNTVFLEQGFNICRKGHA